MEVIRGNGISAHERLRYESISLYWLNDFRVDKSSDQRQPRYCSTIQDEFKDL